MTFQQGIRRTSDLNYPVGQHANSSASEFRWAAHQIHTPQRWLEASYENYYEKDDAQPYHLRHPPPPTNCISVRGRINVTRRYSQVDDDYNYSAPNARQYQNNNADFNSLVYNSRPRRKPDYSSQDTWLSCETSIYNQSS